MAETAASSTRPPTEASPREAPGSAEPRAPVVVDLAKQSRKKVRRLRRGKGPLLRQAHAAVNELREAGRIEDGAQLVFLVVRQKRRRPRRLLRGLF